MKSNLSTKKPDHTADIQSILKQVDEVTLEANELNRIADQVSKGVNSQTTSLSDAAGGIAQRRLP